VLWSRADHAFSIQLDRLAIHGKTAESAWWMVFGFFCAGSIQALSTSRM